MEKKLERVMDIAAEPATTLNELYARIEESERQYQSGEYYTATESNKLLKEKFLWLQ